MEREPQHGIQQATPWKNQKKAFENQKHAWEENIA